MRHRERLQETGRSLVRFVLVAHWAGIDEFPGVLVQRDPPEALLQDVLDVLGPLYDRVAVQSRGMCPLEDVRPKVLRDKQAVRRACAGMYFLYHTEIVN